MYWYYYYYYYYGYLSLPPWCYYCHLSALVQTQARRNSDAGGATTSHERNFAEDMKHSFDFASRPGAAVCHRNANLSSAIHFPCAFFHRGSLGRVQAVHPSRRFRRAQSR